MTHMESGCSMNQFSITDVNVNSGVIIEETKLFNFQGSYTKMTVTDVNINSGVQLKHSTSDMTTDSTLFNYEGALTGEL